MQVGINYLSDGNQGNDYTQSRLETDFALFQAAGLDYVDLRIVWTAMEGTRDSMSTTRIANYKRALDVADTYGLKVGLSPWTQPPYESRNFALPSWVPDWNSVFHDTEYRVEWLEFVDWICDQLGSYSALYYANTCNEPYISSTYRDDLEDFISLTAEHLNDGLPAGVKIGTRFIAGWNPYTGYFNGGTALMDDQDYLGRTIYNDPNSEAYQTASRTDWASFEDVSDLAVADGKLDWVLEYGMNSSNNETQRAWVEDSRVLRFLPYGVDCAMGWAWVAANPYGSIGYWAMNSSPSTPRPSFYALFGGETTSLSFNAVLQDTYLKPFTIDAMLKLEETKNLTVDAVLTDLYTKSFTLDGYLDILEKRFTLDGLLQAEDTATFTIDALLKLAQTKAFTVDGLLDKRNAELTVDGFLKVIDLTVTSAIFEEILRILEKKNVSKNWIDYSVIKPGVADHTPLDDNLTRLEK